MAYNSFSVVLCCLNVFGVGFLRLRSYTLSERLSTCCQMTLRLHWFLVVVLPLKCEDKAECPGAIHRVDWSLVTSLAEMDKPWFQTNNRIFKSTQLYAHRRLWRRDTLGIQDDYHLIRRPHGPSQKSSVPVGFHGPQVVLLTCGADPVVKGSV